MKVEYCWFEDELTINTDESTFMESDPEIGEYYDFCFDGEYVYLDKRDDEKAKEIFCKNVSKREANKIRKAEVM
jgi:hypothetical protein